MKIATKITVWISIFGFAMGACSLAPGPLIPKAENKKPEFSLFASSTFTPTATPISTHTPSLTYTANPIYTAIFMVVTTTNTPTTGNSPTITPTPTKTRMPTLTPLPSATKRPSATPSALPNYIPLFSHVFNNVRVYFGDPKIFVFTIIGASENCPIVPSGRGIFIRYPDGRFEWKDRNALLQTDLYYVKENDPNINSAKIDYIKCPG